MVRLAAGRSAIGVRYPTGRFAVCFGEDPLPYVSYVLPATGQARPYPPPNVRLAAEALLDRLPSGVLVTDREHRVVHANETAVRMLGTDVLRRQTTCCEMLGCGRPSVALAEGCITELALTRADPLPEVRVDLPSPAGGAAASVWVVAIAVDRGHAVLQLRPGAIGDRRRRTEPHWTAQPRLAIHALGPTKVASAEGPLSGDWLGHRPGEILKYLVARRGHLVPAEELLEAFWPNAHRGGSSALRQAIYVLREHLEPQRRKHERSSFIVSRSGGYELDLRNVWVDADEFEAQIEGGLGALSRSEPALAEPQLVGAVALRRGEFVADEPYADWALPERDRLRDLATRAYRALMKIRTAAGDVERATDHARGLADLQPLDLSAQRDLLRLMLERGRHDEAARRLEMVRRRYRRTFGVEPDVSLGSLRAPLPQEQP